MSKQTYTVIVINQEEIKMIQTISIKEARKILGRDFEELDDAKIEEIVTLLSLIAKEMLEKATKGELKEFVDLEGRQSID